MVHIPLVPIQINIMLHILLDQVKKVGVKHCISNIVEIAATDTKNGNQNASSRCAANKYYNNVNLRLILNISTVRNINTIAVTTT